MAKPKLGNANGSNYSNNQDRDRERDKRRRMNDGAVGKEFQTINFKSLDIKVLRKYARVHHIKVEPTCSKEELAQAVSLHFANQTVKEVDAITCFLYTTRHRESVLRLPLNI
ncbi:hypothetical protein BCR43DRAFT_499846 [Syncephalastrum racemosum]|uniref:Histone deacetylase complex subunit SAP30 Sin3 binding domain-containing protein n=1 Tax=Syncephalastrum racemosum TaxID=13706 RepID=A0A1X2H0W1_SYNRA|nr:hypothetical protein BCR43DRAFT_499846 [Syncephalastrum racemosum]